MTDWERLMREMLLAAADQFALYADHHLTKVPPDEEKARTNVIWAARCREASAQETAALSALEQE